MLFSRIKAWLKYIKRVDVKHKITQNLNFYLIDWNSREKKFCRDTLFFIDLIDFSEKSYNLGQLKIKKF